MALNKDRIFKAADNYIRKNRIDKAIAEYETWLKENPKDWNTIRIVGDLYARISRNDEAIKKYAQVADHYRKDGFNVRAIATHKMILRLDPQNEPAMRNLAELQSEEGLLMEAKSYYQTLVELYNKQGHKRLASEVFKKLAEIDPQDVKIRYKYAEFLNKNGKPDEAAREYVGIADQFIGQGLVEEAIKILDQGRSLQTNDPSLKIKMAQASSMQGNHAQAIRLLEEVRRSASGDPAVLARLGEAYLAAGNTDDAQTVYQELAKAQPGNPENVLRLADLRIAQGKFDTALDELSPLADKHVSNHEGSKAVDLLQKVLAKDPYHIRTLLKLAEIHTILKQESGRVSAYDTLCEAYSRAGDYEKAVQVAEQLVELDPESSQHKDRLKFFKSKLAGPVRAPEPARPAAPPPARPAPAPPAPRPAPPPAAAKPAPPSVRPAPPPPKPAPPPPSSIDVDLPDFGGFGDDLSEAVSASFGSDLGLDQPASPAGAARATGGVDLGEMLDLTQEEEENIKEKLTEAEVFVRYGLVDKAIAQLVDVLESFRFHTETREKLVEIYKDQGMNREAGEQLAQLGQVYERLGRSADAVQAREEAAQLNPSLGAQMARVDLVADEDPELILAPESESDLGDVGIDIDVPGLEEEGDELLTLSESGPPSAAEISVSFEEPEIDISFDEEPAPPGAVEIPEEISLETDWGAAEDLSGAASADAPEFVEESSVEDIPISVEEDFASLDVGPAASSAGSPAAESTDDSEEIQIDLNASSVEIPFSVEEPEDIEEVSVDAGASGDFEEDSIEVSLSDSVSPETAQALAEDEFSIDIGGDDEIAVELHEPEGESEETFAPSFGAAEEEGSSEIEFDLPGAEEAGGIEVELPDVSDVEEEQADVSIDLEDMAVEVEAAPEVQQVLEPPRRPSPPPAPPKPEPVREAAPPPRAAKPASPLAAELNEVDEYIALGLYEDARDTLRDLLKQHPGQPDILAKLEELGFSPASVERAAAEPARALKAQEPEPARRASPPPPVRPEPAPEVFEPSELESLASASLEDELSGIEALVDLSEPEPLRTSAPSAPSAPAAEGDFIDLASELSEEIFGTHSAVEEEELEPEGPLTDPGLDQIFREFRKGVEKQLGAEDYDTRYNLGIAYKEMGLLDEAIAEFQLAAKDEVRSLECCSMLGLCFMEKGMPDIAIKWFSKGLALPGRREEEYHGLRYDLAQAFEAANQPDKALQLYMEIFRENIKFRDVQERVKELQAARK
jgi:tetratricopeptide (TPR) repeat protein